MSLFKKKMGVQEFCRLKWNFLCSSDRETVWEKLRAATEDPALQTVDAMTYYSNLRAAYLELLGVSVVRTHKPKIAMEFGFALDECTGDYPEIKKLQGLYNNAYGSSSSDGIRAMVGLFSRNLSGSKLNDQTLDIVYTEFVGVIQQMLEEFKNIKLV